MAYLQVDPCLQKAEETCERGGEIATTEVEIIVKVHSPGSEKFVLMERFPGADFTPFNPHSRQEKAAAKKALQQRLESKGKETVSSAQTAQVLSCYMQKSMRSTMLSVILLTHTDIHTASSKGKEKVSTKPSAQARELRPSVDVYLSGVYCWDREREAASHLRRQSRRSNAQRRKPAGQQRSLTSPATTSRR